MAPSHPRSARVPCLGHACTETKTVGAAHRCNGHRFGNGPQSCLLLLLLFGAALVSFLARGLLLQDEVGLPLGLGHDTDIVRVVCHHVLDQLTQYRLHGQLQVSARVSQ